MYSGVSVAGVPCVLQVAASMFGHPLPSHPTHTHTNKNTNTHTQQNKTG